MDHNKILNNKTIISVFSKCLSSLFLIIFEVGDDFLKNILSQNVNKLLISFIKLQNNSSIVRSDILRPGNHVAQYQEEIIYWLNGLIEKIEIIQYIKKTKQPTSLLATKNLLLLKLLLLNSEKYQEIKDKTTKKEIKTTVLVNKKTKEINGLAEKIFNFISKNEEPPDNRAIFTNFSKFSTRTVRRHLKDLLLKNVIKRKQSGKKVTYTIANSMGLGQSA